MSFLRKSREELDALISQIEVGKFVFVYHAPEEWGVFEVASKLNQMDIAVGEYKSPARDVVRDIHETKLWYSLNPVVELYGLKAVLDTEKEADELALRISELLKIYKEESVAPMLKYEMGISVLVEQLA